MNADGAHLIERACERLILDSATHNDHRDWSALSALYAPDAHLVRPSGQVIEGREAIDASYRNGPADRRTRHVCTNIKVTIDSETTATATTIVLLYSWTEPTTAQPGELPVVGAPALGEFIDTFALSDEGWRIAGRTAVLLAKPDTN